LEAVKLLDKMLEIEKLVCVCVVDLKPMDLIWSARKKIYCRYV